MSAVLYFNFTAIKPTVGAH